MRRRFVRPRTHPLPTSSTPRAIVEELDHYIVGQQRRQARRGDRAAQPLAAPAGAAAMRDEIAPKNIMMIGPTGVGKTEIARRLAKLAGAPFIKVEATKFTEVGYVGRDVDSMVRDLAETAVSDDARRGARAGASARARARRGAPARPASCRRAARAAAAPRRLDERLRRGDSRSRRSLGPLSRKALGEPSIREWTARPTNATREKLRSCCAREARDRDGRARTSIAAIFVDVFRPGWRDGYEPQTCCRRWCDAREAAQVTVPEALEALTEEEAAS